MKFVTEQDLRKSYLESPFSSYTVSKDTKLTPGARQFLADRKISFSAPKDGTEQAEAFKNERLKVKFEWIRSLLLSGGGYLLETDPLSAQKIFQMEKCLRKAWGGPEQEKGCFSAEYKECTGIKGQDFSRDLGDCFEITSFHVQMDRGREITELHRLRCGLRELLCSIEELELSDTEQKSLIKKSVFPMINQLSQMICLNMGGSRCQR